MGLLSKVANVAGKVTSGVKNLVSSSLGAAKSVAAKVAPKAAAIVKPSTTMAAAKVITPAPVKAALAAATLASTPVGQKMIVQSNPVTSLYTKGRKYLTGQQKRKLGTAAGFPIYSTVTPTPSTKTAGTIASLANYVQTNPMKSAAIVGGIAAAAYGVEQVAESLGVRGGAGFIGARPRKKRKKSKKRSTKRRTSRRRKRKNYGTAKQYRRKGGKSVYYTKNGQPYIKLASGKARFVKK